MDAYAIPLSQPFKAQDAKSKDRLDVVGIDLSSAFGPKYIVIRYGKPGHSWPDVVDEVYYPSPSR